MDQLPNYGDKRQLAKCVYCGGGTGTRDHVPSRVLLDEPFPSNLPVVPACQECNEAFSLDEEYLACLLECVMSGSASIEDIERDKVRRILIRKPTLAARLDQAKQENNGHTIFRVEEERAKNVLLKLARGHAAYELNEPHFDEPSDVLIRPILMMSTEERELFEEVPSPCFTGWPEVGSRAMQRLLIVGGEEYAEGWITIQEGRYRYLAVASGVTMVRIVLSEYLGCEVIWSG